jgi:hypothetical protein
MVIAILKIVILLCFLVIPLTPPKKKKHAKKPVTPGPEPRSNYCVTEDGYIELAREEEDKA